MATDFNFRILCELGKGRICGGFTSGVDVLHLSALQTQLIIITRAIDPSVSYQARPVLAAPQNQPTRDRGMDLSIQSAC